jgi:hypothetical protein
MIVFGEGMVLAAAAETACIHLGFHFPVGMGGADLCRMSPKKTQGQREVWEGEPSAVPNWSGKRPPNPFRQVIRGANRSFLSRRFDGTT